MQSTQEALLAAKLGDYELAFCGETGRWVSLGYRGNALLKGDHRLAAATLTVGGFTFVKEGRAHLWNIRDAEIIGTDWKVAGHAAKEDSFVLVLVQNGWELTQTFALNAQKGRLERRARIAWKGEGEKLLRWTTLGMPPIACDDAVIEMPGYSGVLNQRVGDMPMGKYPMALDSPDVDAANWHPGVFSVSNGEMNLVSWLYGEDMPAILSASRGYLGAWFESRWLCSMRIQPGQSVEIGAQYLRISGENLLAMLEGMHAFWEEKGVSLRQPTPQWGREAIIYEANVGAKSFASGRVVNPYPTVHDLMADLERIQGLGFTVIELMPRFPFPGYSVSDYYDIATCYAPEEELKALVDKVHAMGMRILLDVVMHGVADKTVRPNAPFDHHPMLEEHPEFFIRTELGEIAKTYTWSFDSANESFREYITKVFEHYVRRLDVDGFRVDAITWNYFPNWKESNEKPAYKTIDGCVELFRRVRDALWAIKPDIVLYSETTGPLMASSYDLSYCYDEVWMYECLMPVKVPGLPMGGWNRLPGGKVVSAREAAQWLDMRRRVMPKHWIKVHHADSHDTHEWNRVGIYRREYFGLAQSRALFAYCCFTEGAVMNYAGGERESEPEYKQLLALRKGMPALLRGDCDYLSVRAVDPRLLTLLRAHGGQTLVPVINFAPEAVRTALDLSALELAKGKNFTLVDHVSGARQSIAASSGVEIELPAYGYALYQVEAD